MHGLAEVRRRAERRSELSRTAVVVRRVSLTLPERSPKRRRGWQRIRARRERKRPAWLGRGVETDPEGDQRHRYARPEWSRGQIRG